MKIYHNLLLLLGAVLQFSIVDSVNSPMSRIDHLPTNLKPESYALIIDTDFNNNRVPFTGSVGIKIECVESTDKIVLNVKELKIIEAKVTVTLDGSLGQTLIEVKSHDYIKLKDMYIITLAEKLEADKKYRVNIPFKKESLVDLSDLGLVRYVYERKKGRSKEMVALTKADINDARRFFPCMDQMNLKAAFKIRLKIPEHMLGFSSVTYKKDYINSEGRRIYEFEDSIPISTYSLGLVVADLIYDQYEPRSTSMAITLWSNKAITADTSSRKLFINEMSEAVFDFYSKYFDSPPSASFLELLILPNFRTLDTEKFGLIMLDESTLLSSDPYSDTDDDSRADVILHLCYAINRQWLGASASMSNWNEYWVQPALATFLQAPCLDQLLHEKEFNPLAMQLVETFTNVLRNDGESVSRPVYVDEEDFDLTRAFADHLLHDKAHLLIRMMHYFLGENVFQDSVKKYYKDFAGRNSNLDNIWEVFNEIANTKENLIPQQKTIKMIMESWARKKGYPVINMDIDYENGRAVLKQERFVQLEDLENERKIIRNNDYWIIPVNYVTKEQFKEKENPRFPIDLWLTDKTEVTISSLPKEWALLSLQLNVPCRVNYDENTRRLLYKTLMDKDEYTIIDEKSRVQLVFDMFALAEVGRMPYHTLLSTMKYLKHEDSDLVLTVALHELNKIHSTLFDTEILKLYEHYMKEIMEKIYERPRFVKYNGSKSEKKLKKLVIGLSCNFGVKQCIENFNKRFEKWRIQYNEVGDNRIPEDMLEEFYCQAIKHGGRKEWQFLLELYNERETASHNKVIFTALGCSEDPQILKEYLSGFSNLKFPPKYNQSIITGLASNEMGYGVTRDFLISNYKEIIQNFEGYKDVIGFYLVKLFEFTNTNEIVDKLTEIMYSVNDQVGGVENILEESVRMARRNCVWLEKHLKTLKNLLLYPNVLNSMDVLPSPQGLAEVPAEVPVKE